MTINPENPTWSTAVETLQEYGLSAYAARTFVTLVGLGAGTARDVSQVSDVPRTRVYDAAEELQEHGLVNVQNGSPKRFWAVSPDTACQIIEQQHRNQLTALESALTTLEPDNQRATQRAIRTVDGPTAVTDRLVDMFDGASDEILFLTTEALLTAPIVEALEAASNRGVTVKVAGESSTTEHNPSATAQTIQFSESPPEWIETAAGGLVMVDQQKAVILVVRDDEPTDPPAVPRQTAVWGTGETNTLVVVLNALFTAYFEGEHHAGSSS